MKKEIKEIIKLLNIRDENPEGNTFPGEMFPSHYDIEDKINEIIKFLNNNVKPTKRKLGEGI